MQWCWPASSCRRMPSPWRTSRRRCPRGSAGAGRPVSSGRSDRAAEGSWRAGRRVALSRGCRAEERLAGHPKGSRWRVAAAAQRPSSLRLGWAGTVVPVTPRAAAPGRPAAPVGPGTPPVPVPVPRPLRSLSSRSAGRWRRRRRGDCLLPTLLVSSPRHREGQGDWAQGPRPVSACVPGPPLPRALSLRARAGVAAHGAGSSHEPGRGSQWSGATRQRCLRRARCSRALRATRSARDAAPAATATAAAASSQPAPDHPKVRERMEWGLGVSLGHTPGALFCGFISILC